MASSTYPRSASVRTGELNPVMSVMRIEQFPSAPCGSSGGPSRSTCRR
ncbi:hypothetical protein [Actinomadura madurae]|nr:hypothetical protein [Actinomadura madurae]